MEELEDDELELTELVLIEELEDDWLDELVLIEELLEETDDVETLDELELTELVLIEELEDD